MNGQISLEMLECMGGLYPHSTGVNLTNTRDDVYSGYASDNVTIGTSSDMLNTTGTGSDAMNMTSVTDEEQSAILLAFDLLKKYVVPVICVFGLLGNILSLVILTRKRLKLSVDGTERTVHIGLTALAVSDLLFCVCLLPHGLMKRDVFSHPDHSFTLIYATYSAAFINTFILTSTWLTVTMATGRYLAICHPFKARHLIGITGTKTSVLTVFIICLLFNIPRFFEMRIGEMTCQDGSGRYFSELSYLARGQRAHTIYIWFYFIFGILLPLGLLAFCNMCLVKALRKSSKLRRRCRVPAAHVDSNYRITAILVTIVVMYILLVSPSEILLFVKDRLDMTSWTRPAYNSFALTLEVTNILQTINFSCNFVLYFILNVHFRIASRVMICALVRCCKCQQKKEKLLNTKAQPLRRNDQISLRTTNSTNLTNLGNGSDNNIKINIKQS